MQNASFEIRKVYESEEINRAELFESKISGMLRVSRSINSASEAGISGFAHRFGSIYLDRTAPVRLLLATLQAIP